eukprot:TRINITY_DN1465_c0_g1_i2.p1 TRINITY_DN1465_c0_g1~~TRINITY_DN1465_c0_g1_i2.p1  ORF type:complete len:315 (+),score=65.26 TRINITY_DN1465_c0_g1_i2:173-1117(+)
MSSSSSANAEGSHSRRPANTAFKQQRLKAWQPILTPKPVIIAFLAIGIIFVPIGAVMVWSSNSVEEYTQRYDNTCPVGNTCDITFDITNDMKGPVYMYYRMDNYYQNHRRYVKSRNDDQLRGVVVNTWSSITDCDPIKSKGNSELAPDFFLPCGLIARSWFNDTFVMKDSSNNFLALRKNGIAWKSDKEKKFRNPPANAPGIRVISDFEDEDFIVWMRTAGLPDFKKLYRIIDNGLPAGTYTVTVQSNYPVASFSGKKYVVLSTTSWIGGRNSFLGYAYIVVGAVCLVQGLIFALKHRISPRKLGDTKYLEWNK